MSINFPLQGSQASSLPPICGICTGGDKPRIVLVQEGKGIRHWPYEGHIRDEKRDETPNNVTPVTKLPTKGRPKKYASRAEQQRAYRGRRSD